MNLKDEEWEPAPTDVSKLRKVRVRVKASVSTLDVANLRTFLLSKPYNGAIPHEVRGSVWLLLLHLRTEDLLAEDANEFARAAREAVTDDNSREQIEKDVQRTRPGLSRFKQPAVRGALLRLLSLFCKRRRVAYVQGFNELLAPFVLLADTGGNPRIVYALFSAFITRFAPWMLETSETRVFDVLKRMFKYFGRLLLYHDPELYWLLERHMMTPDLYATSWFVTLFARNFTVESVLALWDLLLLEDNPLGTSFFGIALLCSKREQLLSVDESRIPETLMMLTANSPEEIRRLWRIGSEMRTVHTPPSFQRLMTDRLLTAPGKPTQIALAAARAMQAAVCLQTTPDDLVAGEAHFFTWDCRTEEEYQSGHLAQAAYLPLTALRAANGKITSNTSEAARAELQAAVDLCEPLKNSSHICLVGSGFREEDNMDIHMLALYLTRIGIRYVSTLRGGFRAALDAAKSEDALSSVELVDYDPKRHAAARKARVSARLKQERRIQMEATRGIEEGFSIAGEAPKLFSNDDGSKELSSKDSSARAASRGLDGSASFLEKTDAEVTDAVSTALQGMGLNALSTVTSRNSGEKDGWSNGPSPSSAASTADTYNPFSPNSAVSPTTSIEAGFLDSPFQTDNDGTKTLGGNRDTPNAAQFRRSNSSYAGENAQWTGELGNEGRRPGIVSVESSPRYMNTPSYTISPRPGVQLDPNDIASDSPILQSTGSRNGGGFFSVAKLPWGRDAKPGWLGDDTLSYPLSCMPKGFTVNVMDDRVMVGLRLFPCRARSDRSAVLRGKNNDFKRRYVGVSANYFLLLSPHSKRNHLLEVKLIRYLQDIARITFKRSRPELVTFEILTSMEEGAPSESVVCIMPDGLTECVALIKEYLTEEDEALGKEKKEGEDESKVGAKREGDEGISKSDGSVTGMASGSNDPTARTEEGSESGKGSAAGAGADAGLAYGEESPVNVTQIASSIGSNNDATASLTVVGAGNSGSDNSSNEFGEFQAAPSYDDIAHLSVPFGT